MRWFRGPYFEKPPSGDIKGACLLHPRNNTWFADDTPISWVVDQLVTLFLPRGFVHHPIITVVSWETTSFGLVGGELMVKWRDVLSAAFCPLPVLFFLNHWTFLCLGHMQRTRIPRPDFQKNEAEKSPFSNYFWETRCNQKSKSTAAVPCIKRGWEGKTQ